MISSSELIIHPDGSCFHLHLRPEQLADKVVMCGDPERVSMISSFFDEVECEVSSREFHTITGRYKGKRITAISHGIGPDNIDIVLNELDALKNIDFVTREVCAIHRTLEIVRIGTCGGLQPDLPCGSYIVSAMSVGFDGVLNWYAGRDAVADLDFERALTTYIGYPRGCAAPYVVAADSELTRRIASDEMYLGVTVSAPGFYGPQGRVLRLALTNPYLNQRLESFSYRGLRITNFEMESAAVAGFAALLGHKAVTVCQVVANRRAGDANTAYKEAMPALIVKVLERI